VRFRARHLPEECLFECYLAEHGGEALAPTAAEHLTDCPECHARYVDLRTFMDGLRTQADAELDEVFPAERLRAQQQQIARRLEHLAHPARVISFPGHPPDQHAAVPRSRVAMQWVGAAAAAGLLLGVGLGTYLYPNASLNGPESTVASSPASRPAAPAAAPVVLTGAPEPVIDTEQFLSELELALERPHTPELLALDAMTPHVREIRVQLR
jgi:anti-sigma factor RsiW